MSTPNEQVPPQPRYGEYAPPSQPWTGQPVPPPYVPPAYTPPPVLRAPDGTKPYTVWIWLLIFVPMLGLATLIPYFTLDWASFIPDLPSNGRYTGPSMSDQLAIQQQIIAALGPAYLVSGIVGLVLSAAQIVFAWLDWRELGRRGVPQPFHWGWIFLIFAGAGSLVYIIGRIVIVRRRTGSGLGVLWALIATYAFSLVVSIVLISVMLSQIVAAIQHAAMPGSAI